MRLTLDDFARMDNELADTLARLGDVRTAAAKAADARAVRLRTLREMAARQGHRNTGAAERMGLSGALVRERALHLHDEAPSSRKDGDDDH